MVVKTLFWPDIWSRYAVLTMGIMYWPMMKKKIIMLTKNSVMRLSRKPILMLEDRGYFSWKQSVGMKMK